MTHEYSPDASKPPSAVYDRWEGCRDCRLGDLREERAVLLEGMRDPPRMVRGEGATHSLMLIGTGPSWKEEKHGKFFAPGKWIKESRTYERTGGSFVRTDSFDEPFPLYNEDGTPRAFFNETLQKHLPAYKDRHPLHPEFSACRIRLHEEIYAVDPLLILAMGPDVAMALVNKRIVEYGSITELTIQGRVPVPRITKGQWGRKFKGQMVFPSDPSFLAYPMMVLADPEEVLRTSADRRPDGLLRRFYEHLKLAIEIVERHRREVGLMVEERFEDGDNR